MTDAPFYKIDRILRENADYNLIIGERGNGKTYAVQEYLIRRFLQDGSQCMLLRRWMEDVKASNASQFWDGNLLARLGEMSDGRFTTVLYRNGKYIACCYDEKGKPVLDDANTLGYVWDVNEAERLKGQSFPYVENIVYEEFISLSEQGYIPNEVTQFLNIISTIVRDRTTVKIWMLGNTVNPYNPFFDHFGIKGLDLKQGEIWTRYDPVTGCKVALEFCQQRRTGSLYGTSAKYYAFGTSNGATDMITTGKWQIPDYPVMKFKQSASKYRILILFDGKRMLLHYMVHNDDQYIFVQMLKDKETTPKRLVTLCLNPSTNPDWFTSFQTLPKTSVVLAMCDLMTDRKIWFDDRLTGSYFYNFVSQSNQNMRSYL